MSEVNLSGLIANVAKSPTETTEPRIPLEEITPRKKDTRALHDPHVEALSESIAALGLIQPIAVDNEGRLLAGGHRYAAILLLETENPDAYEKWFSDGIPVHKFDFAVDKAPELALAIEASENEKRRDYTPDEVRELADRLIAAGYHHGRGKPKKGVKSLNPSLQVITGKSSATIERYLRGDHSKPNNPSDDGFSKKCESASRSLKRLIADEDCPDDIAKLVKRLLKKLDS